MGDIVSLFSQDPSRWGRKGKKRPKGGSGEEGKEMPSNGLAWGSRHWGAEG